MGRAFVTDVDKLKFSSKTRALEAEKVLLFFSEITKVFSDVQVQGNPILVESRSSVTYAHNSLQDGIAPGANLLHAVEVLVSGVC